MISRDIKYLNEVMKITKLKVLYKSYFCWLYPFTNENIKAYYSLLNMNGKDVLTVTSSGDHILNAVVKGAKSITSFDKNPLAKYYSELKIAAIKNLSYEEFIIFFNERNKYYFDSKLYNRCSSSLDEDTKYFWDYLFNKYSINKIRKSFLFTNDVLNLKGIIEVNDYLDSNNYYNLREILNNVKIDYLNINFDELKKIDKKFDVIILSNILAFLDLNNVEESLSSAKDVIEKISYNESEIVLSYLYCPAFLNYADEGIYNMDLVAKYFSSNEYKYHLFNSSDIIHFPKFFMNLFNKKDSVILKK